MIELDSDLDGFGNICDGDFNQNGRVGGGDFVRFRECLTGDATEVCDFDGDGEVTLVPDFYFFKMQFQRGAPGPSGLSLTEG